jgi:hypothetical protein
VRLRVRSPWPWFALALLAGAGFAVLEWLAIVDPEGLTLSQLVANISHAWPPFVAICGIAIGILIAHFWWPWVRRQERETCPQCGRQRLKQ